MEKKLQTVYLLCHIFTHCITYEFHLRKTNHYIHAHFCTAVPWIQFASLNIMYIYFVYDCMNLLAAENQRIFEC